MIGNESCDLEAEGRSLSNSAGGGESSAVRGQTTAIRVSIVALWGASGMTIFGSDEGVSRDNYSGSRVDALSKDKKEGKAANTQAGEHVREEIEHVREGKRGARSTKQAIAIGLSKARGAGVKAKPGKNASESTKKEAAQDEAASHEHHKPAAKCSKGTTKALKKEGHKAASKTALSSQAKKSASKHSASSRSAVARKGAQTKGAEGRSEGPGKRQRHAPRSVLIEPPLPERTSHARPIWTGTLSFGLLNVPVSLMSGERSVDLHFPA